MAGSTLRNFIVVTIVAILIWAYAESESLRTEDLAASVAFASTPGSGRAVWIAGAPDRPTIEVKVRVEGATGAIDTLRNTLQAAIALSPGVELPTEPGLHSIDLRTAFRQSPIFAQSGVTIAEVSPVMLAVRIDALSTRQIPVRVELPPGIETTGPAEAQQAFATLTLPASLEGLLGDRPAIAVVDRTILAPLTPGRLERLSAIPLLVPAPIRGQPFVSIEPGSVTVTVTLRDQTESVVLPTVPVQIRISPLAYAEWDIGIAPASRFLRNVRATGPSDLIAQIRDGRLPVIAYISLTPEDLTRGAAAGEVVKEVVFSDLPISSNPLKFETEDRSVTVSIQRRTDDSGVLAIPPDGTGPPG